MRQFYSDSFAHLPLSVRVFVEEKLLTRGGHRNTINTEDVDPGVTEEMIETLVRRRLLRREMRRRSAWIEITHDVLTEVIRESRDERRKREEKEASERRLKEEHEAAERRLQEERERADARLRVERAEAQLQAERTAAEGRQREEALRRAEEKRHSSRRALAFTGMGLFGALLLAGFASMQWRRAKEQSRLARSGELAANAQAQLSIDPESAVLLAVEAAKISPTEQAEQSPRKALFESHVRAVLREPAGGSKSFQLSPNGQFVVTALTNGALQIWESRRYGTVVPLMTGSNTVDLAAVSPDARVVVTVDEMAKIAQLWELHTRRRIGELKGHVDAIRSVTFSSDGRFVATTSYDWTTRLWDASACTNVATWTNLTREALTKASIGPDGQLVATASEGGGVHLWDPRTGVTVTNLQGHTKRVNDVAFSPDGTRVVTAADDNTAIVWRVTAQESVSLVGHSDSVNSVAFSPDGEFVVTASMDHTARVWTAGTGELVATLRGHAGDVISAAFIPDGTSVVTVSADKTVRMWDSSAGRRVAKHAGAVDAVVLSPDARWVVTASRDGTNAVWEASTGRHVTNLAEHAELKGEAFSPNGLWVATLNGSVVRVLDTNTWSTKKVLEGHTASVNGAAFSPDSHLLATACADLTARIWDVDTGNMVTNLSGHGKRVNSVAFSPDGQAVVTISEDKNARVWDARSWDLTALLPHPGPLLGALFVRTAVFCSQ